MTGGRGWSGGGGGGTEDPDDLIRGILEDPERQAAREEIDRIVAHIAKAPFDTAERRVRPDLRGLTYGALDATLKN